MIEQNKKYLTITAILLIMFIVFAVLGKCFLLYTDLQSKLAQNQVVIQELKNQNEAQKQNAANTASWQRIAIERLIRMADLTLNTTGDIKASLEFLLEAKKYTNDIDELAINHALDKDIASLQAVPVVDIEELILKINITSTQVDSLSMVPSKSIATSIETSIATDETLSPFKSKYLCLLNKFFISVKKSLENIVIIRKQTIEPILPPEQIVILRFNIQAKLLQAGLAASQRQNKLYHSCLIESINLINKYFADSNSTASNVIRILKELQQINLQPTLPLLTDSLAAIKKS